MGNILILYRTKSLRQLRHLFLVNYFYGSQVKLNADLNIFYIVLIVDINAYLSASRLENLL